MEQEIKYEIGPIDVASVKSYMHIDYDSEDNDIAFFLEVARECIRDALDNYDETKARVRFLVFALTDTLHKNREYVVDTKEGKPPYHIRSMINQLNLGDDSDE